MKKLLIHDMNNVFMRAYHATKDQGLSVDGINTGSIKATFLSVMAQIKLHKPTHCAAIWDNGLPTFRDELVKNYKGTRYKPKKGDTEFDPAIEEQRQAVRHLLRAQGIYTVKAPKGVEADDVIGTTAVRFPGPVVIDSNDKDFASQITDMVRQQTVRYGLIGPSEVKDIFGVGPEKMTEFLMLAGDAVDNVKGAKGIGPVTAAHLLNRYGSIEKIKVFMEDLSERNYRAMEEFCAREEVSRALITLNTRYAVKPSKMEIQKPDTKAVQEIAKRWKIRL